jgi:predicted lipoprotein with Yx(FWY)xxD motif
VESDNKSSYGKRPLWQWLILYLVIGGIVYAGIYFLFLKKSPAYTYQQPQAAPIAAPTDNIYTVKTDPVKSTYLADFAGKTLYVFDKDTPGISNCYNSCATTWPPYSSGATAQSQLPSNITVISRTDGSTQFAWKGMPLYYYTKDQSPGDTMGDGVGGIWHLAKP